MAHTPSEMPRPYLASELVEAREARGMTRSEVAQNLGVEVDLVIDWEAGRSFPTKNHCSILRRLFE